ncbi:Serum response factor [Cucumispora dikerogammari]|nr:Serum response factor [Cucumispora dikerogammari]
MEYITDRRLRLTSYITKKKTIIKKANELAVLTNSQLLFMSVSEIKKRTDAFSTHKFKPHVTDFKEIIGKYLEGYKVCTLEQFEFDSGKPEEFLKYCDYFSEEREEAKDENKACSKNVETKHLSL